jgi:hypothetical protein
MARLTIPSDYTAHWAAQHNALPAQYTLYSDGSPGHGARGKRRLMLLFTTTIENKLRFFKKTNNKEKGFGLRESGSCGVVITLGGKK